MRERQQLLHPGPLQEYRHASFLVECVLQVGGRKRDPLAAWLSAHSERVGEVQEVLRQMRKEGGMDYATLSVAVRSLAQLADDTG